MNPIRRREDTSKNTIFIFDKGVIDLRAYTFAQK